MVVVTSLRGGGGGGEEEKTKQPDRAEAKKSTAISLCRMGEFTSPSELAMLWGAREANFLSLTIPLPLNKEFNYPTPAATVTGRTF